MGESSSIGHLTVSRTPGLLRLGAHSRIGHFNWIGGEPADSPLFRGEPPRCPQSVIGNHSAVTTRHYLDCTSSIVTGDFTTVAGMRSVFFSHEIDVEAAKQRSAPITIGSYCLVGTNCVGSREAYGQIARCSAPALCSGPIITRPTASTPARRHERSNRFRPTPHVFTVRGVACRLSADVSEAHSETLKYRPGFPAQVGGRAGVDSTDSVDVAACSGSGPHQDAYWFLREPVDLASLENLNRRLAVALGADAGVVAKPHTTLRPAG